MDRNGEESGRRAGNREVVGDGATRDDRVRGVGPGGVWTKGNTHCLLSYHASQNWGYRYRSSTRRFFFNNITGFSL